MKKLIVIFALIISAAFVFAKPAPVVFHRAATTADTLIPKILFYWNTDTHKWLPKWVAASRTNGGGDIQPPPTAVITEHDSTLAEGQDSILLHGDGSFSASSTITSYAWTQIAGGDEATIVSPSSANTLIKTFLGLGGDFTFRLTVTDENGKTGHADIVITKPGLANDQFYILDSAKFNFTPTLQNITGYTDVVGDPAREVVTATADNGMTISTVGVDSTLWNGDPNHSDSSGVALGPRYTTPSDPYNYEGFDSSSLTTGFENYMSEYVPGTHNLELGGLDPDDYYQIRMFGAFGNGYVSTTNANASTYRSNYVIRDEAHSVNGFAKTSGYLIWDTVKANEDGKIFISVTGTDTTSTFGCTSMLSAMTVYHISRDSSAGAAKTELFKHYYDTTFLNDGTVNRLCIYYKPYNYDPSKSYPLVVYLDGQEDAVKGTNWDDQILTADGIGIVAEHEKGKLYGLRSNGDTASFWIVFPQTSLDEWSLSANETHNIVTQFKNKFSSNINDSTFVMGFSSGAIGATNYLYSYPYELKGAFIQSPAPQASNPMPSSAILRDTSAKFDDYGINVWLVRRGDAFAANIDSIAKYIKLVDSTRLYERIYQIDHSGFAQEYLLNKEYDPVYEQSAYDFLFNPTKALSNDIKVAKFCFGLQTANQVPIGFQDVIGNPSYNKPSQQVITVADTVGGTMWQISTVATSKWAGTVSTPTSYVFPDQLYQYYTNQYNFSNQWVNTKAGGVATNGANFEISNLTPNTQYSLFFWGVGLKGNNDVTEYSIVGGSSVTMDNSQDISKLQPVKITATSNASGIIDVGVYPQSGIGRLNYLIIKQED